MAQRREALSLYGEHCQKIAVSIPTQAGHRFTWCDRQQLWKAVITGDMIARHSIPIRGHGKITWRRPEVKFGRNLVKKKQHKNYQDEDKKSAINKKINSTIKKPHLKIIPIMRSRLQITFIVRIYLHCFDAFLYGFSFLISRSYGIRIISKQIYLIHRLNPNK